MGSSSQTLAPKSLCASSSLFWSSASLALLQRTLSLKLLDALWKMPPSVSLKLQLPLRLARAWLELISSPAWRTTSEPPRTAGNASATSFPIFLSVHKKLTDSSFMLPSSKDISKHFYVFLDNIDNKIHSIKSRQVLQ